jgi:hypothetical protein
MSVNDLLDMPPGGTRDPRYRHDSDDVPNLRPRGVRGIPGWILALLGVLGGALSAGVPVIVYMARMPDGPQWQEMSRTLIKVQAAQDADRAAAAAARDAAKQHELDNAANINLQFENLKLLIKKGNR